METLSAQKGDLLRVLREKSLACFERGDDVLIVRSPGRINLIGEHTDYNDGFVLPSAIDRSVNFIVSKRNDLKCRFYAAGIQDGYEFDVRKPAKSPKRWANYLIGIIDQLQHGGHSLGGFDCLFGGNIPIGAGLSSSAAIEAGLAFALNEVFKLGMHRIELAMMAQKSEREFVGVMCGIMDQFANLLSKADHVFKLDCRSNDYEYIPFEMNNLSLVLCDTGLKHELANSEYNVRRRQCGIGVEKIAALGYSVSTLRDVSLDMLKECEGILGPLIYNRCSYVLEENDRVEQACKALSQKEFGKIGELLFASHEGLRNKYNVSCEELDFLVETAARTDGVLGARMMGAGFGGCTINLVRRDFVQDFKARLRISYQKKTGKEPAFYDCRLASGTEVVTK
jgi:galactokinase